MLNTLPLEILLSITRYLPIHEKLVLITTSRALHDVITKTCLYQVVKIRPGHDPQPIVRRLALNDAFRTQVKRLTVECLGLTCHDHLLLPETFPRVKQFVDLSNQDVKSFVLAKTTQSPNLQVWKNSIIRYRFQDDSFGMARLLETDIFSKLTTLHASQFYHFGQQRRKVDIDVLECIKHAPMLKELYLQECKIDLVAMETIHTYCPMLWKLELYFVLVDMGDTGYPSTLVPADGLGTFILSADSVLCDKYCLFLKYIMEKYSRLNELSFLSKFNHVNFERLSRRFHGKNQQVVETKRVDYRQTQRAYANEGSRLLLRLATSLQFIGLNSPIFTNVVERLNQTSVKPKTLSILDGATGNSFQTIRQVGYITKLNSLKQLRFVMNSALQIYAHIIISNTVTTLTVGINGAWMPKSIDIQWILSAFPSLNKLSICESIVLLKYDGDIYAGRIYPKLQTLIIINTPTDIGLVEHIPTIAPNLKCFKWMAMNEYHMGRLTTVFREWFVFKFRDFFRAMERDKGGYRMDLTSYHLNEIHLVLCLGHAFSNEESILCLALNVNHQTHILIFSKKNFYSLETIAEGKQYSQRRDITVKCNPFKKLRIDKHLITMKDGILSYPKI